jgi:two-component system cell cycle response regulator
MAEDSVKVLLVEDNHDYAWMLRLILNQVAPNRYDLVHIERLSDALQSLHDQEFDVILLDLSLPDSRGFITFSQLYEHASHIPIVVMTAMNDKELALRAVRAGAQDYLVKGEMDVNRLVQAMQYAVERHLMIENLRRLSLFDELTGLLNRRGFLALGDQQMKIAQRSSRPLMLFFADLDGLKLINDQHGHAEGDRALKRVAAILRETFRSSDLIARLGGDEFTVLAIDAPVNNEQAMRTRLYETIDRNNQANDGAALSLSLGVARYDPQQPASDLVELMAKADRELYEDKSRKRSSANTV